MITNTIFYNNVLSVTTDDGITKHYRNIFYELDQNSSEFMELMEKLRDEHNNDAGGIPLNPPPDPGWRETVERPIDDYHHGGNYEGPLYAKHPELN